MTDGSQWGHPGSGADQPHEGHPPYGQPPSWAPPPGSQPPYGQPSYGQPAYGQVPYGQPAYGQIPYGQAPYGQPPYGQAPYGPPVYGQFPYGSPGPGGWPGERRPSVVTAAGVLGIVTGALTAFGSLIMLIAALSGETDVATLLLLLGLPCAVGLITGGVRVLQGHAAGLLFGSALAAVGVLLAALAGAMLTLDVDERIGVTAFVVVAAVLPIITAVLSRLRQVTAWAAG